MSDTDTFVDIAFVWIVLAALGGIIIYAYWPPLLAMVWISENLVVLTLAGLFQSMSDTDAFAGVAFVWIVLAALGGIIIYAYWPPSLAIAWMLESLIALILVGLSRTPSMEKGLWVWASDERTQRRITKKVSESKHLMAALEAINKRKEGLSNAELDDLISDNSSWMTLSVMRELLSLGFVEYQVDLFGNPGRYTLTDLGRDILQKITGQVASVKPSAQVAQPSTPPGPMVSSPAVAKPETRPAQP
jgi:hypothetical protein